MKLAHLVNLMRIFEGLAIGALVTPITSISGYGESLRRTLRKSYQLCTSKPTWQVHYYGKAESKVGRKMGHVTITTPCLSETLKEIETVGI